MLPRLSGLWQRGAVLEVTKRVKDRTPHAYARRIVVDWDGTAVKAKWPEQTREFMPGFVDAMRRFHEAGFPIVIESARFNPCDFYTQRPSARAAAQAQTERAYVRSTLDDAGLTFIDIHDQPGKPTGMVYIDDKGERYGGNNNSWKAMVERVLVRAEAYEEV